jgi:hypothetical protein
VEEGRGRLRVGGEGEQWKNMAWRKVRDGEGVYKATFVSPPILERVEHG